MRLFIIILTLVTIVSCNRKVIANKTIETHKKDSASVSIDTSSYDKIDIKHTETISGDSLKGILFFGDDDIPGDVKEDSLESSGIKIKVGIITVKGGFKARINAVSKPVKQVYTEVKAENEKRGKYDSTHLSRDDSVTKNDSSKTTNNNGWIWFGVIVFLLILIAIYFLIKKYLP
ncbi:MAG: hypothetical protein C0459_03400 [Chitinophaga sp.]|jgi:hypothetical protein|nr:hypothetical protein [Chitinophaga sp.]